MKETLLGNPPVVPDYLAAKDTLSKLVRFPDGKPTTRMVGKAKSMQTIQQQTEHLGTSECTQTVTPNPHNELRDTLPAKLESKVSYTSRRHTKQQHAEHSVQQINELLDTSPAKLQSKVSNTSRHHTTQQQAENSVQQINELLDISPTNESTSTWGNCQVSYRIPCPTLLTHTATPRPHIQLAQRFKVLHFGTHLLLQE